MEDTLMKVIPEDPGLISLFGSVITGAAGYAVRRIRRIFKPSPEDASRFQLYDEAHGITFTRTENYCWENNGHSPETEEEPQPKNPLREVVEEGCPANVECVVREYHKSGNGYSGWVDHKGYAVPFRAPNEEGLRIVLETLLNYSLMTETPLKMQVQLHESGNFLVWND